MDQQTAIKLLYDFLHDKIKATGTAGFEGLVSVLLQQATGQEFRLSSSGRQSGRDSASESGYANVIKLESKHYRESTSLDLRELIAEIHEAVESDPNLDIWILASSRSVSDQIASSLDKVAETHGIDVVLLDLGINGLPRLAVLMAAFSSIVIAWANRNISNCDLGAIQLALIAITAASDFESAKSALIRKLNSMIGYDSARRRIHNSLRNTLSDDNNAKSTFCQSLSIRSPSAQVVRRSGLNRQFDQWWDVSGFPLPCVALGEEGTGKTWAVFDWVMGRIDADEMPIVLPFAAVAQDLSGPHLVETLLPRLFAKWTAVLDERRWKRRLDRWLRSEVTGKPLILLIVDGINERANVDWRPFFNTLLSDPWRDKIAVLGTDRPHHWQTKCPMAGWDSFCEITVEGYSDRELDRALSGSNISYQQIPQELLRLISRPRYCRLIANHYKEMIAEADFTLERLIYLEIKDRYASKSHYPLTEERLFEIIEELAKRARRNPDLKPADLRALITVSGANDTNIYEEIVSGGLLIKVDRIGMPPTYKVEPLRLVYGFGMLLGTV